jgi:putative phosphonate catabolism associated alcohol dehydrogenase
MNSQPDKSRAAVFRAPNQPLTIESFPLPSLGGREAIARILCTTVCGSDLHSYTGRRHSPAPSVLGHEMVGEICSMGPDGALDFHGNPLAPGDRVTWSMVWSCGACFYCSRGLRPKCEHLMKFGHEQIAPGRDLIGGLAEHCILREGSAIFRVPANVPDLVASPANCATATVAAVFRNAGTVEGQTVVVLGAGMLGLTACAMASALGAACVIAIEIDPARAELALRFGASLVLDGSAPAADLRRQILDQTAGRGAEFALEFTGMPEAIEAGFDLLRFGGHFVLAGATFPSRPVALPAEQLVRRMLQITGVYNYEPADLATALDFLSANIARFPFETLVGRTFSLDHVQAAFEYAEAVRPPRVAVVPAFPRT